MKCDECRDRISEYIDRDMPADELKDMQKHIGQCEGCRAEVDSMGRVASMVRSLPRHEPNTKIVLAITRAINTPVKARSKTSFGPVLDVHELAEFLRVTPAIVDQYLDEIPCFELGGKLLFNRKSIEEWIERREEYFQVQIAGFKQTAARIRLIDKPGDERWKAQRSN